MRGKVFTGFAMREEAVVPHGDLIMTALCFQVLCSSGVF